MEDWKEEFHKRFVQHYYEDDIYNFYGYGDDAPQMGSGKEEVDKVIDFIEQELSKAREDGRRETLLKMQREFSEYGVPDDVRYTHPLFYINNIIEEKLSKLNN